MPHFDVYKATAPKFSAELMEEARIQSGIGRADFENFCEAMRNRTRIGELRYEGPAWRWIEPDQEATIGKDWRIGYAFFDWKPELYLEGRKRKLAAYGKSGNRELLYDVANYAAFAYLTHDGVGPKVAAAWIAWALREFYYPEHPEAHFRCMDQDIDGTEASGSLSTHPEIARRLKVANG